MINVIMSLTSKTIVKVDNRKHVAISLVQKYQRDLNKAVPTHL